ncbi:MAG UNVERIFIED_CONTAM: hypothetical protein LVQ98_00105 [Rickettsiaceae bacterium]|jgi:hypothetical protein
MRCFFKSTKAAKSPKSQTIRLEACYEGMNLRPNIHELNLSNHQAKDWDLTPLGIILYQLSTLPKNVVILNLSNANIPPNILQKLPDILKGTNLKQIDLSSNEINDSIAQDIFKLLTKLIVAIFNSNSISCLWEPLEFGQIKHLELKGNHISQEIAEEIMRHNFEHLDLSGQTTPNILLTEV